MKMSLKVNVVHDGASAPDQFLSVDVTTPKDDDNLDQWADAQLTPQILKGTTAVPGDEVIADCKSCDELSFMAGVRFTLQV